MNKWTRESIKLGNTKDYLDILYGNIYPFEDKKNELTEKKWISIEKYYNSKNLSGLLKELLTNKIFPFEHPTVGYFRILSKKDIYWFKKNPIQRDILLKKIFNIGLDEIKTSLTRPIKKNQQIGPMFKNWIDKTEFCIPKIKINNYKDSQRDCILIGSDKDFKDFARIKFKYLHKKGLDFIAKKNGKFIVGEQKLITDQGGNQNKSLEDVNRLINSNLVNCKIIGILDGVLYLNNAGNLYTSLTNSNDNQIMLSALLIDSFLRDFK